MQKLIEIRNDIENALKEQVFIITKNININSNIYTLYRMKIY